MPVQKRNRHSGGPTVPEALAPWWRVPFIVWPLVILVGGGLLAAFGAKPAWRLVKQQRAAKILTQGEQLFAEGKIGPAIDQCRLAFQLTPESPRALRLMAECLTQAGARSGLDYWRRLLAKPDATESDHESFADFALQHGLLDVASTEVSRLATSSNPSPRSLLIAARYHLLRNETTPALELFREIVRRDASNPTNLLAVGILLQARTDDPSRQEGRGVLWQVASNFPAQRRQAWEALTLHSHAERADREQVVAELEALPNPGIREQVLLAEIRMNLDPSATRTLAEATLNALEPRTDADRLTIVQWLHRHSLYDLSLPLLTTSHVRSQPALFRARIESLIAQNRTDTAYRELLADDSGIDPLDLELLRYQTAKLNKDDQAAAHHRESLLRVAGREPDRLRRVAEFAERTRMTDLATDAWKRLVDDRYDGRRALRALATLADRAGDTWAARENVRRLAKLDPAQPLLRLQVAHYDLLLGENSAGALDTAESLVSDPDLGNDARFIVALAHLRAGDGPRAAATLRGTILTNGPLPPPLRTIAVATLGSIGETNQAAALARSIPIAQLRPEEKDLIRPYLLMPRTTPRSPM